MWVARTFSLRTRPCVPTPCATTGGSRPANRGKEPPIVTNWLVKKGGSPTGAIRGVPTHPPRAGEITWRYNRKNFGGAGPQRAPGGGLPLVIAQKPPVAQPRSSLSHGGECLGYGAMKRPISWGLITGAVGKGAGQCCWWREYGRSWREVQCRWAVWQ